MREEPSNEQKRIGKRDAHRAMAAGLAFAVIAWLCLISAVPAMGGADGTVGERLNFSMGDNWSLALFPTGRLYDTYIADPLRPGFSMVRMGVMESDIPDAGTSRYNFMLGGRYGLLKLRSTEFSGMAAQIDIYGAFLGQFDPANSTDNIGWDGLYGLMFTWACGDGLSLKLAMAHDSSHVGDEYSERTGRRRIGYTRQEIVFGISYRFQQHLRAYGETGYGYDLRNPDVQAPWRVKGGIEFEDPARFFKGRLGYYTTVDLSFTEEMDWDADMTAQAGVVIPMRRAFETIRIGPMYRNGRSVIGEFFRHKEEWWGLGLWIDI